MVEVTAAPEAPDPLEATAGAAEARVTQAPSQTSPTERKKRNVTVKKATAPPKAKKQLLVARKARPGEEIPRHTLANVSSPGKVRGVRRTPYGGVLDRTVLGSAERFEEYEAAAQNYGAASDDGASDDGNESSYAKGQASPGSRTSGGRSAGGRSPTPSPGATARPSTT